MSRLILLLLLATAGGLLVLLIYAPEQWRQLGRRMRTVAYAYVAAILIGAVLRMLGFFGT